MRLLLRQKDGQASTFNFDRGPISIGRGADSNVLLPHLAVSRKHAVIKNTEDGKWLVQDLDSAGKTFLNDRAVRTAEIKHGDCLRITDFTIEIELEETRTVDPDVHMDDTLHLEAALATPPHETVVRKPDAGHAPAMRLAARRLTDFSQASERVCRAESIDTLLLTLLDVTSEQFNAFNVWCALRAAPAGPMTCHAGRKQDGTQIDINKILLREKIIQAVEKGQFLVMPRVSAQIEEKDAIRSAMIAAIVRPEGCFGVLYADNEMKEKHYSLSDLDYLMLLAMHTAAVMQKFVD